MLTQGNYKEQANALGIKEEYNEDNDIHCEAFQNDLRNYIIEKNSEVEILRQSETYLKM